MMTFRVTKSCVYLMLLFPIAAVADGWQQYSNIMSRYYHIDQQAFTQITCKVEAQPLQGSTEQMRQQLSGMSDKLRMTDTLDKYQLIFDKKTGLSFQDPSMSIDILSEKGMADPSRVRMGIGEMTHGFDQQVQGLDTQLKGLFEGYETSKQSDIEVDKIDNHSDGIVLTYKKDGGSITDAIHGSAVHTVQTLPNVSVTVDSSYKTATGGKLILDTFDMKMIQGLQPVSLHGAITYQSLGGVTFPAVIEEHGSMGDAKSVQTNFVMTINLTNCQLHK